MLPLLFSGNHLDDKWISVYVFWFNLDKNRYARLVQNLIAHILSFLKIGALKIYFSWGRERHFSYNYHIYVSNSVKFGIWNLHLFQLNDTFSKIAKRVCAKILSILEGEDPLRKLSVHYRLQHSLIYTLSTVTMVNYDTLTYSSLRKQITYLQMLQNYSCLLKYIWICESLYQRIRRSRNSLDCELWSKTKKLCTYLRKKSWTKKEATSHTHFQYQSKDVLKLWQIHNKIFVKYTQLAFLQVSEIAGPSPRSIWTNQFRNT
jgi:hypothetical protein